MLKAVLSVDRSDKPADSLTDDDVATLRHPANRHRRQYAAGACLRSYLYRVPVLACDRRSPAVAGAGIDHSDIYRPRLLDSFEKASNREQSCLRRGRRTVFVV